MKIYLVVDIANCAPGVDVDSVYLHRANAEARVAWLNGAHARLAMYDIDEMDVADAPTEDA